MLPAQLLYQAPQHLEGLGHDAAVRGVAAVEHVGLQGPELLPLRGRATGGQSYRRRPPRARRRCRHAPCCPGPGAAAEAVLAEGPPRKASGSTSALVGKGEDRGHPLTTTSSQGPICTSSPSLARTPDSRRPSWLGRPWGWLRTISSFLRWEGGSSRGSRPEPCPQRAGCTRTSLV